MPTSCTMLTTRCVNKTQVGSLQALEEKRASGSLSGHSCLEALCALASSQLGQWDLSVLCLCHPVECVGARASKRGRD